ncbi:hypothetical protein [Actinomadura rudentiformis]|uniref:SseB protein N-terminal domain-containing protein n=1 Tax=Actinomadura rudentiformis TaxID=359158 RepID=A0A6H9YQM6_9ACTN|nr:hypothetical protein [Actinomadura rudentiformis]KAB2343940.1 hypothetical protein F8566_31815 [Actinomadura rudentiformis]
MSSPVEVGHVWVPAAATGAVPVLQTDDRRIVVAFTSEESLPPELPPGCAEWQHLPVEQLALVFPEDVVLLLEPGGHIMDLDGPRERATALVNAATQYLDKQIDAEDLVDVFRRSIVYCQAGDEPGFLAHAETIAVFSSLITFTQSLGDTAWFSTTGQDVLDQLNDRYELFLDPWTSHATEIPRAVQSTETHQQRHD